MRGYVARDCYSFKSVSSCRPAPRASSCPRDWGRLTGFCLLLALISVFVASGTALAGNTLASLEEELAQLVQNVKPSIVTVSSQYDVRKAGALSWPLAKLLAEPGQGTARLSVGSGIVFAEEIIVTSGSVVRTSGEVTVAFEDGRSFQARVLGVDKNANVCVLRVTGLRARPIPVGNSRSIKVGSLVVLMGNSFGRLPTVALATVSGRQKVARTHGKWEIIQLSGPVHPGNSGGAVLNTKGELVAMVMGRLAGETAKPGLLRSPAEIGQQVDALGIGSGNVGLALPAEEVRNVVEGLLRSGRISEGYLGVRVQSYQGGGDITRIGLSSAPGVEISEVLLGSPAQKAGLRNGDVLSEFDGEPVLEATQLSQMVGATRPGDKVKVSFWRGARRMTATVQISAAGPSQNGPAPAARPSTPKTERVLSTEN